MKMFKLIDAVISSLLILITGIWMLVTQEMLAPLLFFYMFVGTWHCISMLVHTFKKWDILGNYVRWCYHFISLVLLIGMPLGTIEILMFTSPFLAIFYTALCFYEIRVINLRPIQLLK